MKSLTSLWSCTANELAVRCCTSATRDIKYVESRTEHEGLSFLAITLASYGTAIQKWLERGFVVPSETPQFKRAAGSLNGFPAFLSGFLGRVFSPSSGTLLDDYDIEAIYALRQLTLMFSKIALPENPSDGDSSSSRRVVSEDRERRAMSLFVQTEQDVRASDARLDFAYLDDFKRMSEMLFGDLFTKMENSILSGELIPKHGPGAVADRLSANAKWNLRSWTARLQGAYMHPEDYLYPNLLYKGRKDWGDQDVDILEPGSEMPVRVITVPKTLKAPRVIAIEPAAMQYAQQSLLRCFLDAQREDGFLSRVIGVLDQEPNRLMAREGSLSGDLATLDLSEASDRVSNQHVRALLHSHPILLRVIDAARSRKADVPGHGVIRLAKYASMGSALCFPVEAMTFLVIIFLGIERELGTPLSREAIVRRFSSRVRVFGDDIIVPTDHVLSVVDELHGFGHVVNTGKSYWTGRFRESCGKEYFDGHDVSIVRVRQVLPTRLQDASAVNSAAKLRNLAYWSGLWKTAAWLDSYMSKTLKGYWPNVSKTSALLGRESVLGYQFQRLCPNHHSPLTKGYRVVSKSPQDHLDGMGAHLKCLVQLTQRNADEPPFGPNPDGNDHLERSGRPERVDIKLGWSTPY
jgi:hypothetical protein